MLACLLKDPDGLVRAVSRQCHLAQADQAPDQPEPVAYLIEHGVAVRQGGGGGLDVALIEREMADQGAPGGRDPGIAVRRAVLQLLAGARTVSAEDGKHRRSHHQQRMVGLGGQGQPPQRLERLLRVSVRVAQQPGRWSPRSGRWRARRPAPGAACRR